MVGNKMCLINEYFYQYHTLGMVHEENLNENGGEGGIRVVLDRQGDKEPRT